MGPDEIAFRAHVARGSFQSGTDRGRWRLIRIDWPHVLIAVRAAARPTGPAEYIFRFDCTNYPDSPPTARPWDLAQDAPLDAARWPGGRERVPFVFNPTWNGGQCLYLPYDRGSLPGHDLWRSTLPSMIWTPASDITDYLGVLDELLTSPDYTGPRAA